MSKPGSIAANSIYYLIYQVFNVLFPFVLTLYGARVLLPESVGTVLSAQNITNYFAIFAFLGIPTYGRREISKARNNSIELSKLYSELFVINAISTLFFCIAYTALILSVPDFRNELPLYLITGGAVALNFFNNSWLFEGLEDFRFISVRNIIFKSVSLILLFLLVKSPADYLVYALILVIGTAGNYILNIFYAPTIVRFTFRGLDLRRHMGPVFALLSVNIAIELYSLVDVTMIRFIKGETHVAFYSYAQGINKILQQVLNTFTIVVVPRLALYFKENKKEEFNSLISKTFNSILILALPMIAGVEAVAYTAVTALYGNEYEASVPVLRLLIVLLVVSPMGYLLGSRVLLVTGHEKKMAVCVWAGAAVNIIGNAILIPLYAEIGAAAASVISEVLVATVYIILGSRYFRLTVSPKEILKALIGAVVMGAVVLLTAQISDNLYIRLAAQILIGVVTYFGLLLVTKESLVTEYRKRLSSKYVRIKK
ncbi:MAG: flippase [Clostridiales bacterium]|nr:flippase [Clostridiales bacterium]